MHGGDHLGQAVFPNKPLIYSSLPERHWLASDWPSSSCKKVHDVGQNSECQFASEQEVLEPIHLEPRAIYPMEILLYPATSIRMLWENRMLAEKKQWI
jgi:hypothetical protein